MKREIKFRAKSTIKGEEKWVYGHYSEGAPGWHYISNSDGSVWPIDPETVGEFTGLTCKGGKEIYEGDIIRCGDTGSSRAHAVKFVSGCFVLYNPTCCSACNDGMGYVCTLDEMLSDEDIIKITDIMGNIHDDSDYFKCFNNPLK